MPFTLRFDGPVLCVDLHGRMVPEDLVALAGAVAKEESALERTPDRIIDTSAIDGFATEFSNVMDFAQRRRERTYANAFRVAVVAESAAQLGVARMFQTIVTHEALEFRIFGQRRDAEAWLGGGD